MYLIRYKYGFKPWTYIHLFCFKNYTMAAEWVQHSIESFNGGTSKILFIDETPTSFRAQICASRMKNYKYEIFYVPEFSEQFTYDVE